HRHSGYTFRVSAGVWILAVDSCCQTLHGAQKQFPVFVSRTLKIADVTLNLIGHEIEGVAEVTQLRATANVNSLREIARGNAVSAAGQFLDWLRQLLGKEEPNQKSQQACDKADQYRLPPHVADGRERCRFILNSDYTQA